MIRKFCIFLRLFACCRADLATGPPSPARVRIVVPAHDIARGDTIGESDLTYRHRGRRRPDVGRAHQDRRGQGHAGPPHAARRRKPSAATMCAVPSW